MALASAILQKKQDFGLINKMTIVRGYSGLHEMFPLRPDHQRKLREAAKQLRAFIEEMEGKVAAPAVDVTANLVQRRKSAWDAREVSTTEPQSWSPVARILSLIALKFDAAKDELPPP